MIELIIALLGAAGGLGVLAVNYREKARVEKDKKKAFEKAFTVQKDLFSDLEKQKNEFIEKDRSLNDRDYFG